MELIADGLLAAGALGAAFYCFVLSRRLSKFNDLENGVGGAVAVLSAQVDDLTRLLQRVRHSADKETEKLEDLTSRAEAAAKQLELMMASMHDLPQEATEGQSPRRDKAGPDRAERGDRASAGPVQEGDEDAAHPRDKSLEPVFRRAARRA